MKTEQRVSAFQGDQSGDVVAGAVSHQSIFVAARFNGVECCSQKSGIPGNVNSQQRIFTRNTAAMDREHDHVRDRLWNAAIGPDSYKDAAEKYQAAILEQYKLYVEMADRSIQRRLQMNTFFLAPNVAFFAIIGVFLKDLPSISKWFLIFPPRLRAWSMYRLVVVRTLVSAAQRRQVSSDWGLRGTAPSRTVLARGVAGARRGQGLADSTSRLRVLNNGCRSCSGLPISLDSFAL